MAKFIPLGDRIIVKATEEETTTASGLVLPDSAKEKPQEGEVIAIGSGRVTDDGENNSYGGQSRRQNSILEIFRY